MLLWKSSLIVSGWLSGKGMVRRSGNSLILRKRLRLKGCFSFCGGLAVSRQDGVFYEISFDGVGAVCRLGDVTGWTAFIRKRIWPGGISVFSFRSGWAVSE